LLSATAEHLETQRKLRSGGKQWVILGFLMALCFISHFNRASITTAGDERIMAQFQISPEKMGLLYAAFLIVYTLFMIPAGWFVDRCGPRLALACMGIGSAVFCAFTGAIGFGFVAGTQVWFALLLVRSMMGLLSAPLHPSAARAVGSWFPPQSQALANGLITGASILAYAVVHGVFGKLIDIMDWPRAFVMTGAMTAALAVAWYLFGADYRSEEPKQERASDISPFVFGPTQTRGIVLLTLSYAAVGYFQYLFFYWLHYYFDSVLHMNKDDSRLYAGLPSLAMACCMPLGGWITDRAQRWGGPAGRTLVPKAAMIISALLLLLGIAAQNLTWIVLWFTLSLGVLGLCEAAFWTMAVELGGKKGGMAAAIMNTGGNGIGLLAPVITPFVGRLLGWNWGIAIGAAVGLLGAACWFGIRTPEDRSVSRL
jgi:ACS family D-galactonate transporter-like MFS transporter